MIDSSEIAADLCSVSVVKHRSWCRTALSSSEGRGIRGSDSSGVVSFLQRLVSKQEAPTPTASGAQYQEDMTQYEDINVRTTIAVIQLRSVRGEGVLSLRWPGRNDGLRVRSVGAAYG
jgi:hypothetical protein